MTKGKNFESYWQSLELVKDLVLKLPSAVFWKDSNCVFMGCNEKFAEYAGLTSPENVIGKTDYDLPWEARQSDVYQDGDRHVMETRKIHFNIEETQRIATGETIDTLVSKAPILNSKNEVVGVLGVYFDISVRKKLELSLQEKKEKAEQLNKTRYNFLENMRHEIRTPLSKILDFAEKISQKIEDEESQYYAKNIISSLNLLLNLIDEASSTFKIIVGEMPVVKYKFHLRDLVKKIVALYTAEAKYKKIALSLTFDEKIPDYVISDASRIYRILFELMSNAIKFTQIGYVKMLVNMISHHDREMILQISVEDSGIGFSKEIQQSIFLEFKRATPAYTELYKGVGAGLPIIKQLIGELNAEIYVSSTLRKGTLFTCLIPFKEALTHDVIGVEEEQNFLPLGIPLKPPFYGEKVIDKIEAVPVKNKVLDQHQVLLVEDNELAAMIASSIFSELNCKVKHSISSSAALELIKTQRFDLIVVDLGLPNIDGAELTEYIRHFYKSPNVDAPIVALTAHVAKEGIKRCLAAGINQVLLKPLAKQQAKDLLYQYIISKKKDLLLATQLAENTPFTAAEIQEPIKEKKNIINFKLLFYILGNNRQLVNKTLHVLIRNLMEESEQLTRAYEKNNWKLIQMIAHKIRGSVSYCGAIRLRDAASALEEHALSEKKADRDKTYKKIMKEINLAQRFIEKNWHRPD